MTARTERPDELSAELRSLRPRGPSAAMRARIARELSGPRRLLRAIRDLGRSIPAAAVVVIVLGIVLWPRLGGARASSLPRLPLPGGLRELARQVSALERETLDTAGTVASVIVDIPEQAGRLAGAVDDFSLKDYADRQWRLLNRPDRSLLLLRHDSRASSPETGTGAGPSALIRRSGKGAGERGR